MPRPKKTKPELDHIRNFLLGREKYYREWFERTNNDLYLGKLMAVQTLISDYDNGAIPELRKRKVKR